MRSLAIGGVGLAAGTTLAIVFKDESDDIAGTAIMLILSLSAGLCGAAVPGVIKFNSKTIRASGATVFFILPWLMPYARPDEHHDDPPPPAPGQPGGTGQPGAPKPPPPKPGTTFKPPPLPTKTAAKPSIGRPRTIFDGLFTKQSAPDATKSK